ncbi:3-oxoacyl-ACP synthase III family protein [Wenjunlia tyrosinilytica]|uniref:3-oxoacyl-[acyl-carrier-protein] synthase III n=1 Tax=Wenjunlia tyrosinilytica TaxID=1544741 RepID=A0A917ZRR3_9ACTN|nr:3-oxoacyl-ACP synthase III family protein [Wenjunlia tyrosinilytica]GGO89032.1 3-oxoacyl-[acyl-carrier-protein] synthase III [Wenjunlia tyrosinilytica]
MTWVHVIGAGTSLPGEPVDNDRLGRRLGISAQWVEAFIGTRTRHFAVDLDDGRVRYSLADLCTAAGRQALDGAGLGPGDIDAVVLATATPDTLMPTTAAVVADRLGIDGVPAVQIQSGCSGAVQALDVASALLARTRRRSARAAAVLVVGGDVCTKHLALQRDFAGLPPAALVNYALFGDGAGAVVLSGESARRGGESGGRSAVLTHASHRTVGAGLAPGQVVEWFGPADIGTAGAGVAEDYKAIEERVPRMSCEAAAGLLKELDWAPDEVDFLLPPQLGGRMTAAITRRLREETGLTAATEISCVSRTGNNGNALPLLQLALLLPRLGPGDRALGVAIESSKWITASLAVEGGPG